MDRKAKISATTCCKSISARFMDEILARKAVRGESSALSSGEDWLR